MRETTGTQAIDRAALLLVRVVESAQPPSIGELAERTGLPKSTTSRGSSPRSNDKASSSASATAAA